MTLPRLSPRRRQKLPDEQRFREELMARVGCKCEFCGAGNCVLDQHEIARGSGLRQKQRTCLFGCLVLCRACHGIFDVVVGQHAVLLGLAVLRRSRPQDFNLKAFTELVCPQAPRRFEMKDVELWSRRIAA